LSKPIERYRQSDVNFWGVAAIAACGLALSAASIPALMPPQLFTALHASRINGADINALRAEMASLEQEAARIRNDTEQVLTRLGLADQDRGTLLQRVGALESTLPVLVEQIPPGGAIDTSIITSATGNVDESVAISGGRVEISRSPLYPRQDLMKIDDPAAGSGEAMPEATESSTMLRTEAPDLARVSSEEYGIAVGGSVTVEDAYVTWLDVRNKVGALLIGMEPILSASTSGYHIVAGPVERIARAEELCGYVERAGLQCLPMPYSGYRMPQ